MEILLHSEQYDIWMQELYKDAVLVNTRAHFVHATPGRNVLVEEVEIFRQIPRYDHSRCEECGQLVKTPLMGTSAVDILIAVRGGFASEAFGFVVLLFDVFEYECFEE